MTGADGGSNTQVAGGDRKEKQMLRWNLWLHSSTS